MTQQRDPEDIPMPADKPDPLPSAPRPASPKPAHPTPTTEGG